MRLIQIACCVFSIRSCATPLGTSWGGTLCIKYNCEICLRFRTYLFVRALLAKTPRGSIHVVRAVTVVAVWARSAQCVARGKRLKFFRPRGQIKQILILRTWEWIITFPGFLRRAFSLILRTWEWIITFPGFLRKAFSLMLHLLSSGTISE